MYLKRLTPNVVDKLRVRHGVAILLLSTCLASCAGIPPDEVEPRSEDDAVLLLLAFQVLDFDTLISLAHRYGPSDAELEEELRAIAEQKLEDLERTLRDPHSLQGRRKACDNLAQTRQWFSKAFEACGESPDGLCNAFADIVLLCQDAQPSDG